MSAKRALITGITGQDGSYLAELLLQKGYSVHGIVRRVALEDPEHRLSRVHPIRSQVTLHAASLESYASIHQVVEKVAPDECYHLAAQSFVAVSWHTPAETLNTTPDRVRAWRRGTERMDVADYMALTTIVSAGLADAMRAGKAGTVDVAHAAEALGVRSSTADNSD